MKAKSGCRAVNSFTKLVIEMESYEAIRRDYYNAVIHCRRLIETHDYGVEDAISETITGSPVLPVHFEKLTTDVRAFYADRLAKEQAA